MQLQNILMLITSGATKDQNAYVGIVKEERMSPAQLQFTGEQYNENHVCSTDNSTIHCCPMEIKGKVMYPLKFPCPYCSIKFSNENTLKAHLHSYCTRINSKIDAHQNRMNQNDITYNWLEQHSHIIQPLLLDSSSSSSLSPHSVLLEAIYHPDRLEVNKCFRNGDIYFVAVRLDMPKVLSPTSPPMDETSPRTTQTADICKSSSNSLPLQDALDLSIKPDDLRISDDENEITWQQLTMDGDEYGGEPLDLTCKPVSADDLRCVSCGYMANTLRGMRLHERSHNQQINARRRHGRKRTYSGGTGCNNSSGEGISSCDEIAVTIYTCVQCGVQFSSLTTLNQHRLYYCRSNDRTTAALTPSPLSQQSTLVTATASSLTPQIPNLLPCRPPALVDNLAANHSNNAMVMNFAVENRCEQCNINFRHKSSYVAHKLHYCKATRGQHPQPAATAQLIK
ncbi:hypothetical protein GJ496_008469 [Pomphorhynchus laevis]|nr:hypothetical protein GJ496_008469 [Pomphorhynchus laevis]